MASLYFWLAGLVLVIDAGLLHDRLGSNLLSENNTQPKWARLDWLLAASLTVLALCLRLYQIGEYLPPVHGDEGEMGTLALLARHGRASGIATRPLSLFTTGFLDHPTLFHYLQAVAMVLFGETITALRILSAIVGGLCAPFLYATGLLGWGRITGLTAGWLLAVSHLHIHYSRIALNNIETVWFVILLIWLLALAYESNHLQRIHAENEVDHHGFSAHEAPALLTFIIIGLVIGLGQYFYYGSRLMPVLAAITLYLNFNTYFVEYRQQQSSVMPIEIARDIADAGKEYRSYLLGAPNLYVNYGTIRFVAVEAEKYDLEKPEQLMARLAESPDGKGALLIALPHRITELEQIEEQFPNGTKEEHQDMRGNLLYVTYQIPAEEVTKQLAGA
jgi:hypothetical protein